MGGGHGKVLEGRNNFEQLKNVSNLVYRPVVVDNNEGTSKEEEENRKWEIKEGNR